MYVLFHFRRRSSSSSSSPSFFALLLFFFFFFFFFFSFLFPSLFNIFRSCRSTGNDPFDAETNDPKVCGAADSSLWELHTLTKHYNRQVSQFARRFRHDIVIEASVSDILGGGTVAGYAGVFDEEVEPDTAKDKVAAFEFREQPDLLPGKADANVPEGVASRNLAPRWCT